MLQKRAIGDYTGRDVWRVRVIPLTPKDWFSKLTPFRLSVNLNVAQLQIKMATVDGIMLSFIFRLFEMTAFG